jgi:hypothetical protein
MAEITHHIFAVNYRERHPRVTPIPIGFENAWRSVNGRLALHQMGLPTNRAFLEVRDRDIDILRAFSFGTNAAERSAALAVVNGWPGVSVAREAPLPAWVC